MTETLLRDTRSEMPEAPPLFVTAYSPEGERQEALVEPGRSEPSWLASASQLRIQAPGGATWNGRIGKHGTGLMYDRLLSMVGGREAAWASVIFGGRDGPAKTSPVLDQAASKIEQVQLWTREPDEIQVSGGPLFVLQGAGPQISGTVSSFAVVRRTDHSVVHVGSADRFYIDILPAEGGSEAVPRALVDTSLAGAFWGYTEHQIPAASRCAANRLLQTIFSGNIAQIQDSWLAAAAHAVLTHRELLPEYGERVRELLRPLTAPSPDAAFLRALIGLALLASHKIEKDAVKKEIRHAITLLAASRVTYGETLRWLDLKFLAIKEMARKDLKDSTLEDNLAAIASWLRTSYAGGQIAAYAGEAPVDDGWHDALAEKKTPSPWSWRT